MTDFPALFSRVAAHRGILPEGLIWDAANQRLSWVDIEFGTLSTAAVSDGNVRLLSQLELNDQLGCALPTTDGGFICGLGRRLARVSPTGRVEHSGVLLDEGERFNDGHIDPQGRLVIGSLRTSGPDGRQVLVRLESSGELTLLENRVGISNGIGWSPDGTTMYHVDTLARRISRRPYGDEVGHASTFIQIDGMPDGIAVDEGGNIWVTVFDQGRIDCYDARGALVPQNSIVLTDTHVASVAFGAGLVFIATGMPIMPGWLTLRRSGDGYVYARESAVAPAAHRGWAPVALPTQMDRLLPES